MQGSRTQKSERSQPKVTKNFGKKRKKLAFAEEEKDLEERREENTRCMKFLQDGKFIKLYDINKEDEHYIIEVLHTMFYCILTSFCAA